MATITKSYTATVTEGTLTAKASATVTVTYSVTNTEDQTTVTASRLSVSDIGYVGASSLRTRAANNLRSTLSSTAYTLKFDGATVSTRRGAAPSTSYTFTGSRSVNKTHSTQTKTVNFNGTTASVSVPARPSYAVSYDLNSGTGAISNSTKWYDEPLTLTATTPTKEGYVFTGWATSLENAGDNITTDTYTANAPATFYAAWELAYTKPSVRNISIDRCDALGQSDDEGTYAKVSFDWSVFQTNDARYYGGDTYPYASNSATCEITVGTFTVTPTLTGSSGSEEVVVGDGSFTTDTSFNVSGAITDTQVVQPDNETTFSGTLGTAYFPMDFMPDGHGVAFGMPAKTQGLFECDLNAQFNKQMLAPNYFMQLDTTAQSGDDHDIYTALQTLGWDSEVIV